MSTSLEHELTATFADASDFVQPDPALAGRIRAGARRRQRRTLGATAVACAAAVGIAATAYAVLGEHKTAAPEAPEHSARILATVDYDVTQLAASGSYLYVLAGQNDLLAAYDRATGTLIRLVKLPAELSDLAVGPGGLIWVSFSGGDNHRSGIWLLGPDLLAHSALSGHGASGIVPTGRVTALVPSASGVLSVRLPAPGSRGTGTEHLIPATSFGPGSPGAWAGLLGGRVAALFGPGTSTHLALAGRPGTFGGARIQLSDVTSTGNSLWATTFAERDGEASLEGPLVRLNSRLKPTTPASITANPVLARSEGVWSAGDTVWVATGVAGHSLVCFTAGQQPGPVTTLPVIGEVVALTATSTTVYVNALQPPGSYAPSHLTAYPVPAACR